MIEITTLAKTDGPLTKRISLVPDGSLRSDGSACVMSRGRAGRAQFDSLQTFAACIGSLNSNEAIALGALRDGLPDQVQIVTKDKLPPANGAAHSNIIARTGNHISYRPGDRALALLDHDTKGMPSAVRNRIDALGGFWPALVSALPEIATAGRVVRRSTSAGICRTDTGEPLAGSNGQHIFVLVKDGADVERFLRTLHERCWLHNFGWMMVGAGGQLLDRSIVDRMVGAPERLVFEATPVLDPPLAQDQVSRRPIVTDGAALDTITACPPLTIVEQAKLSELRAKEAHRLAPESTKARDAFISHRAKHLAERTGMAAESAARVIAHQCAGILLPDVVLPFDDAELAGVTVADVLADPARYEGETLADPLEGVEYGPCKAKIMRRPDGCPWIHSFAHGRTLYELKHNAAAIETVLGKAAADRAADEFVRLVLAADVAEEELDRLKNLVASRANIGKRVLDAKLRRARGEQAARHEQEARARRAAERLDPRPQIPAPALDAPWLPQMTALNQVLGKSTAPEPPTRDVEGAMIAVHERRSMSLHTLTADSLNCHDETRLPAPEQPLLTRLDEAGLAELIERHIEHVDATGRPVHLGSSFVRHYLMRSDGALPVVTAVATTPMVLPDGTILAGRGLDRDRGIVFRIPDALLALLPDRAACTDQAVAAAMSWLVDEWLVDVATDYPGKCVLIATALTILERLLLPERPAVFVTAGQRGGGKTTALHMISMATLGRRAAACGWSSSEEERRKALFAYLGEGLPFLCWDNLSRGAAISCPSIEKALTAETYSDRVLGETQTRTVPAFTVMAFTGNNCVPRGDLASRSLCVRLAVDRPDPENRIFHHADPIGWTEANRGRALAALYTILLGNPRLRAIASPAAQTRFKAWWHLVGSAVEHAADLHVTDTAARVAALVADRPTCPPVAISFRSMFLAGEADEEQTSSLATVLDVLRDRWVNGFRAGDVALFAGQATDEAIEFKAALEQASGKPLPIITPTAITWRLKALKDAPVLIEGATLALRYAPDKAKNGGTFIVRNVR